MKEIKVTDEYLGLDDDIKNCQTTESFEDCTTRQYLDTLLEQCGCLPLYIRLTNDVSKNYFSSKEGQKANMILIFQYPICTSAQFECVHKIKFNFQCLPPCSGLIVTSFSTFDDHNDFENLIANEVSMYEEYTKWTQFPLALKGFSFHLCFMEIT